LFKAIQPALLNKAGVAQRLAIDASQFGDDARVGFISR
jgi:hypothetical protein